MLLCRQDQEKQLCLCWCHRNPSFEALEQLSIVFDRTMSYILGESDDPSSPELGENEIQKLGLWSLEEDYMEIMMK